jgi:hypothetical protein
MVEFVLTVLAGYPCSTVGTSAKNCAEAMSTRKKIEAAESQVCSLVATMFDLLCTIPVGKIVFR